MEPPEGIADVPLPETSAETKPLPPRPVVEEDRVRVKRESLSVVIERCRRALESLENANLDVDPSSVLSSDGEDDGRSDEEVRDLAVSPTPEGSSPQSPSAADSETDELCALLKSKVESPKFLEKLGNTDVSIYQKIHADDNLSWDLVSASELWEDKFDGESSAEDAYILVGQEDVVDGIASFMAAYLLSLKQAKEFTPNQLQKALSKAFGTKKRSRIRKVWDGSQVIYNFWNCSPSWVRVTTRAHCSLSL